MSISSSDLREFNQLSKRHNYFMTSNRTDGFPSINKNSIFLKTIIANHMSNSIEKNGNYDFNYLKRKNLVKLSKKENISYNNLDKSPLIFNKKKQYMYETAYNKMYRNNKYKYIKNEVYNNNTPKTINSYNQELLIKVNKNLNKHNYYKLPIHSFQKLTTSPDIINKRSNNFSYSNTVESDSDIHVLNFHGIKIFTSNSFYGLNNEASIVSPEKKLNKSSNKNSSELYRNYEELRKKKDQIYKRKMKHSSNIRKELYKKEKDKEIKGQKLNIKIQTLFNNNSKSEKEIQYVPIKKKIINYERTIENRNKSKDNKKNIQQNFISSTYMINAKKNSLSTSLKNNNKEIIDSFNNNINDLTFSKDTNSNIIKENESNNQTHNDNNSSNNNTLYTNKSFKSNNVYISKYSSPGNNTSNNKNRENSESIRKKYEILNQENEKSYQNKYNNKTYLIDRYNIPYNFIYPRKKFIEDYKSKYPIIMNSRDKKVTLRIQLLKDINEAFSGKRKTKEKLRMQRVISIYFNNDIISNLNFIKNKGKIKDLKICNNLSSIKEEDEKSKLEVIPKLIKDVPSNEIKMNSIKNTTTNENINNSEIKYELIKTDSKTEKKNIHYIKKFAKLNTDVPDLIKSEKIIEEQNNKKYIKKRLEKYSFNHKSELTKDEPKNNKKENLGKNINKKYVKINIEPKSELINNKEKNEIRENQIDGKYFRRRYLKSNPNLDSELLKTQPEMQIRNKYFGETEIEENKDDNSKPGHEPIFILINNEQNEQENEIEENQNYRKNLRKNIEKLTIETQPQIIKNEEKNKRIFNKKFEMSKPSYESQIIKEEPKKEIIKVNKIFEKDIKKSDSNIESKNESKSEIKNYQKNFRRGFKNSKSEIEPNLKKNELNNEINEKKDLENNIRYRYEKKRPEKESQLKKDEIENDIDKKQNLENNNRKRYIRQLGNNK